jgi:23S rRNA (guanosine2251-2'-O)-methyltransferase
MERYNNKKKPKQPPVEEMQMEENKGILAGRNAVMEQLKSDAPIDKLFVAKGEREGSIKLICALALEKGIPLMECDKNKLDRMAGGSWHQGVVAMVAQKEYVSLDELFAIAESRGEAPFFVICDGISDPHNLGALIRCAEGAGAHGVILSKRHCVGLTPVAAKASAGALSHMAVAKVPNIASAIETLKERGVWVYGAEAGGSSLYKTDLTGPAAFVMGSEGEGISRLVKEKCDFIVSIEMYGHVNSFNVSCAAAVVLCEAAHQRHGKG